MDLSTFNYSLSKHSIWDQCVNRTDINTKKLNDLIEVYENDLFVCNNSKIFNSIRYLNLKTFKGLCVKEDFDTARTSFKQIKIDRKIDYYVNSISINKNGKLLALIGEEGVNVMIIPQTINQINVEELHANIISVGSDIYSSNSGIKIIKAAWHPLSSTNSHIVILSSDGCLRLFDVSSESKEPEQLYYIGPQYYNEYKAFSSSTYIPGRSISGNSEEMETVSFTFGSGEDWEIFTTYVLMKNGDVYAICPFLPSKSTVKKSLLEGLSLSIEQRWKESDPDDLIIDQQYRLQRCWISTVLQNLKPVKSNDIEEEDEEVIINGNISRFKDIHPVIQGPFLLQPAPIEFDTENTDFDNIASSIISLKTEPFSIILIAYTNGKVDVCLNVAPIEALWMSNNDIVQDFELPILAVYETIDLNLKNSLPNIKTNVINIKEDKRYPDVCYLYHHAGVHSLSFNNWLSLFKDINNNNNLIQKFQDILRREIPSEVNLKVDTLVFGNDIENPIIGLATTNGVYIGYNLLVLGATNEFVSMELPIRIKSAPILFNNDGDKDLFPIINLNCPLEIHLGSNKKSDQIYPNFVNNNTLKYLNEQIAIARKDLTELEIFRNKIEQKVMMQKEEFFKQLKALKDINKRVNATIKENSENISKRMNNIIDNQTLLMSKANILLQILFDHCQPELTEEEKKWFNELKHLSSIVTKKHKPHIKQLRQQLDLLKEETKDKIEMIEQAIVLGKSQKKTVFEALDQESINIMNTLNNLNILQNKLENLRINDQ
ncbi:hypothetical protein LY90DRAFT_672382 [Neocallimastix californiae]|jgi:hypothetical protein|uniref:Uncharacterized protein n=1 Tax=Neocallimastix californiae TaxID=1754190 RepID=A0A1Y2BY65_9FUNG|nr:hypothetical protein LY90DRAFT_672382 [Neocallimastix californiae]|eukprot:ORY39698.1 hypothetical protein LY90DRAFT_672382 [Neocallimastix californiae]